MSTDHAVTVVIPTHNRRLLLRRTLDSVLRQRGVDVQVVIVDDGGSDGTPDAISALGAPNVRLIRHPTSRGVSAARNAGIEVASTPWVAFVDDDDMWAPDKLAAQIAAIESDRRARWSCVGAVHLDCDLNPMLYVEPAPSGDVLRFLLGGDGIPGGGSGVLVSRELADDVGGFDEKMSILADWDFYLRVSKCSPVAAVPKPLLGYYIHLDSMYHNPYGIIDEFQYLEQKYADWPGISMKIDYPTWYLRFIRMETRRGNPEAARRLLAAACRPPGPGRGPLAWGMVRWGVRRFTDPIKSVPEVYAAEVAEWSLRYRDDSWCSVSRATPD